VLFNRGNVSDLFKSRYGVLGRICALEVTVGDNGWHVHLHELLLLAGEVNYFTLEQDALRRWQAALAKVGFSCNARGVDVTPGAAARAKYLARYLSKFATPQELLACASGEWGIAQELALSASKIGHKSGRTPLQLLIDAHGGDQVAGELYQEYAAAFFGKKHLDSSNGTSELLGVVDRTEVELVDSGGAGRVLRLISSPEWIRGGYGSRPIEVLRAAIGGA
jgi:hypothetical protein